MEPVTPQRPMEIPPVSLGVRALMLAACLTAPLQAQQNGVQIAWASDAFAHNVMADGTTTFGGSPVAIRFEIGTFREGFDPTAHHQSEWAANWVTLQTADYDPVENQVIQTATLFSNDSPFRENTPAYIWGYNTKDVASGIAEWIVLSADEWMWPSASSTLPSSFSISDASSSSEMLMGSVNGMFNGVDYHMRLEAVVIPEPSVFSVLALSSGIVFLRRRR